MWQCHWQADTWNHSVRRVDVAGAADAGTASAGSNKRSAGEVSEDDAETASPSKRGKTAGAAP